MGKVNRGKQFEHQIESAFEKVEDVSIDRFIDPTSGYLGVCNICDYVVYKQPYEYYIECKSCYGNTLPFKNITDNQWRGLLAKSNIKGVIAGYLIWFIDRDITVFVTAEEMAIHKSAGYKSLNCKDLDIVNHIKIAGKKKRILFDYDMSEFFEGASKLC